MPTTEERLVAAELQIKQMGVQLQRAINVTNALEGRPSDATLSIPHNDSWIFFDNEDGTHPGNLRYVVAANVTRIVSARLSFHLAPYRTYNNFSVGGGTGAGSAHLHPHTTTHSHQMFTTAAGSPGATAVTWTDANGAIWGVTAPLVFGGTIITSVATPGSTDNEASHTHPISSAANLGVTEGATATNVAIAFDGVDQTVALGGPFSVDVVELNVRPYIGVTQGVFHTITLSPSGLGRIEAHLRLGVYVSAGQLV